MSNFDRKVLEWLAESQLPSKSQSIVLERMAIGISTWRNLSELEPKVLQHTGPTLDFSLADVVTRAQQRLEGGVEPAVVLPARASATASCVPRSSSGGASAAAPGRNSSGTAVDHPPTISPEQPTHDESRTPPRTATHTQPDAGGTGEAGTATAVVTEHHHDPVDDSFRVDGPFTPSYDVEGAEGGMEECFAVTPPLSALDKPSPRLVVGFDAADNIDAGGLDEEEDMRRRAAMKKRSSRGAISSEVMSSQDTAAATLTPIPKPESCRRCLVERLTEHHHFVHLENETLALVADVMEYDAEVLYQHSPVTLGELSDLFYVVVAGEFAITEGDASSSATVRLSPRHVKDDPKQRRVLSFGQGNLLYANPSDVTIMCVSPNGGALCTLSRPTYKIIVERSSTEKRALYGQFLSRVPFLAGLTPAERLQLADALKTAHYIQGDFVIRYGEPGSWFSLITEGEVEVLGRDDNGETIHVCCFGRGQCVGELEFLYGHKTLADVVAKTPTVKTAKMTAYHFERLIGTAREVLERQASDDSVFEYYRQKRREAGFSVGVGEQGSP